MSADSGARYFIIFTKQNDMTRMMQTAISHFVLFFHHILSAAGGLSFNFQHREFLVCSQQQKTMAHRHMPDADLICMAHQICRHVSKCLTFSMVRIWTPYFSAWSRAVSPCLLMRISRTKSGVSLDCGRSRPRRAINAAVEMYSARFIYTISHKSFCP
jgi:hypothetical protein